MVSGLSTIVMTVFLKLCADITSRRPITIYRPQCPPGYCALGDYAQGTSPNAPNYGVTLCFRAKNGSSLLARPVGYRQIWSTEHGFDDEGESGSCGSGSFESEPFDSSASGTPPNIVAFWRAIPPSDEYVSIGDVVTTDYDQPSTMMTCVVHKSLVAMATRGRKVWQETSGSASVWTTGRSDDYLDLRTFRTNDHKNAPDAHHFRSVILEVSPPQHDGTYITKTIRGEDLKLLYRDHNSGAYERLSIYVPQAPPGFIPIGYYAEKSDEQSQDAQVMVIKPIAKHGIRQMVTPPVTYRRVIDHIDNGRKTLLTMWRPIPAPGYHCLGDIATVNKQSPPLLGAMACLHWSLLGRSRRGSRIWWNREQPFKRSYRRKDFTLWGVGSKDDCDSPNTFVAYPGFVTPPSERLLFHCIPKQSIEI